MQPHLHHLIFRAGLLNGKQPNIIALLIPHFVIRKDQPLSASYANNLITTQYIIAATFSSSHIVDRAMQILQQAHHGLGVAGINCSSFHCLSQQEKSCHWLLLLPIPKTESD